MTHAWRKHEFSDGKIFTRIRLPRILGDAFIFISFVALIEEEITV